LTFIISRVSWRGPLASPWDSDEPIREELFSAERLEQHARTLAIAQKVTPTLTRGHPLAVRLADNATVLLDAYRSVAASIDERRAITPAAEWLVDNYYLVERQIREIRAALPPGYYRELPKLANGPFAGYPRVFGLAWAFVAHTDSHFDTEMLCRFVSAYQEVQPLTIGELWAVAITLRIVLVENLRRLAQRITQSGAARQQADRLADRLLGMGGRAIEPVANVLAALAGQPLPESLAVQLVHRLRDQDPRVTPALLWLDEQLAAHGSTADTAVREEHQRQGAGTVTVRNIITSMRMISDVDWPAVVERISLVDRVLSACDSFAAMDFPTRDLYRRGIEDLARGAKLTELDVAREAVREARGSPATRDAVEDARRGDPGYYLVAEGRRGFEAKIGFRAPIDTWSNRLGRRFGIGGYVGAVITVAAILLAIPLFVMHAHGTSAGWLNLLTLLGMIPAADAAVALVNRSVTRGFEAALLPALALRGGVPEHLRTVVAVPTLLTTVTAIEEQIERLEIHHLASPEGDLHFALLSDWLDAATERVEGDAMLLDAAIAGVARLNQRYGPAPGGDRFLLLHRKRVWNESEGSWIGWERKRGKLHELNRLLRGADDTSFMNLAGPLSGPSRAATGAGPDVPADVRYVITLDADTRLPRDTVHRLIGKMAHPLNRPAFDAVAGRVVTGYAVLQPRVTPALPVGREGSLFQRVFSSMSGIDPYASAVSDVYQDLFGEGSYAGKGIYDIDAFEAALAGRVPDSTMLSHDLFEGSFARAGLASDIEVVEDFPTRYDVSAMRHHRWARGDWQLLPWIFGRGPLPRVSSNAPEAAAGVPAVVADAGSTRLPAGLRRQPTINASPDPSTPTVIPGLDRGETFELAQGELPTPTVIPGLDPGISRRTPPELIPGSSPGMTGVERRPDAIIGGRRVTDADPSLVSAGVGDAGPSLTPAGVADARSTLLPAEVADARPTVVSTGAPSRVADTVATGSHGTTAVRGDVPALGRWKMLDNLRRTVSAPACMLSLLAAFALPLPAASVWTGFILLTILLPSLIPLIGAVLPSRAGIVPRSHLGALGTDVRMALARFALVIAFMAHQAWLMGDAIARTLTRLFVTHRHLLEWVPAAQVTLGARLDLAGFYRVMASSVVAGVLAMAVALLSPHQPGALGAWPLAWPFAALWIASPALARWTSRALPAAERAPVSAADADSLKLIARRTWRFFETFVTPADNMLPPDNFQEDPVPAVAHRTSPTNLGLYLLSVATAQDFGWVGTIEAVERLEATLATMGRLERFRGHFYNWYDTTDLHTLDPPYISTVDSGNLAGHLITLANACREWTTVSPTPERRLSGIADALALAREAADQLHDGRRTQTVTWHQLEDSLSVLADGMRPLEGDESRLADRLAELAARADTIADMAAALVAERGAPTPGGANPGAPTLGAPDLAATGNGAPDSADADVVFWIAAVRRAIESHRRDIAQSPAAVVALAARLATLEAIARATALEMGYGFLLDPDRKLLSIGYRAREGVLDPSCYDLLASEARLASFIAIAKGDVPARHWFHLGRAVTPIANGAALISWSGSMFEYLMPSLVMRAPAGSLIEQTTRLIVRRQIAYGHALGLPWGISESAYNARDLEFTYQYSNFGVPGLGLKRGLGDNAVVAPYATALATMVDPRAAARNLTLLASVGGRGRYGFYEALDYTPARLPEGATVAIVRAYMAHHQGMSIVAIADALLDGRMRTRFHTEPMVQATELLLQERTPRDVAAVRPWAADARSDAKVRELGPTGGRRFTSAHSHGVATHLLSNGRYAVMLTASGSGYSRWRGLAVTRWREDPTRDDWGSYIFLRDVFSGEVWSAGVQPAAADPDAYEVIFNEDRAELSRRDRTLTTTMEVLVSSEDDAEVRRISIVNHGGRARDIDVTSYAELVLGKQADDVAHPAFMKLFTITEYLADQGAILATRRRRSPTDPEIWAAHLAIVEGDTVGKPEVETDRARFIGRGHGIRQPISVIDGRPLSNTVGTVLDPVFALRRRARVVPGGTVRIAFWTMVASSREAVLDLVDKHRDPSAFDRAATLAWTQAQVQLHHLGIDPGEASLFQTVAGHLLYAGPAMRPSSDTIRRGAGEQSGLWPMGISGDLPIVLLRIADMEAIDLARRLLQAHEYWRMKQLAVDLVILNERASSYVQDLQIALETQVRTSRSPPANELEQHLGRVFVPRADLIPAETRALLASVARVVLVGQRGTLADQLDRVPTPQEPVRIARKAPGLRAAPELRAPAFAATVPRQGLEFFNGLGGFAEDGREYVTILGPGQSTPAPWINVVANPGFGFQVATEGSGYTWSVNSRENQLTPWSNDPVSDRPGEAFYIRDEETGDLWCPTATPIRRDSATYVARHGFGYSRFEHDAYGIAADLLQYVPIGGAGDGSRGKPTRDEPHWHPDKAGEGENLSPDRYPRPPDRHPRARPEDRPAQAPGPTFESPGASRDPRVEPEDDGHRGEPTRGEPTGDPIKISRLTLMNVSGRARRLSVTAYVEWVLGPSRTASAAFVSTEIDPETGAMFARDPWHAAFAPRVAFADLAGRQSDWTGDRREFIGRDGSLASPVALTGAAAGKGPHPKAPNGDAAFAGDAPLSKTVGSGLDPCGALRTTLVLPPGGVVEIVFFLGQAANAADARDLIVRYREADLDAVLLTAGRFWDGVLGAVQVKTPDRAMDIMLNGWLLYQTLVCRVWARSGFYQSSGAYGFRDQLQDGMALANALPAVTRAHLPRSAARQFLEGDVQHWWLPHSGQGVRTRISDDRAWLAYTVAHYVGATGDTAVLDEVVPYLEGQLLGAGEHDAFFQPTVSDEVGSLFEHCARALDASLATGVHGLPLMGTGDWNDGMNRVGELGQGESVWLGWLLLAALEAFIPLAESRQETARAAAWRAHADALRDSQEREAWDGDWYRRAWFDDGTPLGATSDTECRIDAISQSWALLSAAGDRERAARAMASVERELIRPVEQLALLFAPPFDKTTLDPGYIKGYPPGIRENGGQYTHAALWSVMAFAALGEGDKAAALFALLNPINHARTRSEVFRYKVEPYVIAADVYARPPHTGRGGWTWYTGSGGWMQRAGVESILGARLFGDTLALDPCIPKTWPRFEMTLRYRSARYEIVVENPDGVSQGFVFAEADGTAIAGRPLRLKLQDDGRTHRVVVKLG